MRRNHSILANAVYQDLMRNLLDDAVGDLQGTPTKVHRGDKTYWYDSYRIGSTVRTAYIGEDTESLRQRLAKYEELKRTRKERANSRSRLIRILRAEGFLPIDVTVGSLLAAMQRAGVFRLGGTLVGTQAFRFYEGELGVRFGIEQLYTTEDIDIASFERLSLALRDSVSEPLQETLSAFRFAPAPTLDQNKTWRWTQTDGDLLVEFLTPSFEEDEGLKPLVALGVHAQSLHYLNFLIADPIPVAVPYRYGVLAQVPRPERFAVHKLIVADRRQGGPDVLKARKDRAQAAFLIDILAEDRPGDLADAFEEAWSRGTRWRARLSATLKRLPETAERLRSCGLIFDLERPSHPDIGLDGPPAS
jgi:hypothetical protein